MTIDRRIPAWAISWWIPVAVYTAQALSYLLYSPHIRWDFPLDDAWIHRVYARALAGGHGLAYNDGALEVGTTSPLWVLITAPVHWLQALGGTQAVVLAVKLEGLVLGATAVAVCWFLARHLFDSPAAATLAASIFAVESRLVFSALSGMENPLLVALWLGLIWALVVQRGLLALVLLGLTPLARPEAVLLFPFVLLGLAWTTPRAARVAWLLRPSAWIATMLPTLVWAAYCKAVSDHWLPTTYYVKSKPFEFGLQRAVDSIRALTESGWPEQAVFWVGLLGWCFWLARRRDATAGFLALATLATPLMFFVAVVGSRTFRLDGYYWTRWTDPPAMIFCAAFALGMTALLTGRLYTAGDRGGRGLGPLTIVVSSVVAVSLLAWGGMGLGRNHHERRARLASDSRAIRELNVKAGQWIQANTPPDAVVAVNDAGAIRYFGRRQTLDLLGLNNADIAFTRLTVQQLIDQIDYLAIFPSWFGDAPFLELFETIEEFRVPEEQYTICDCPGQSVKIIAVRRGRR